MDFKDLVEQLSKKADKLKETTLNEEATKMALVTPFLQTLGYDVFDPTEVVPEFTCDIGIKKGEKIDYAIMMNNEPVMLIECKPMGKKLDLYEGQLIRYFTVSKAKFAVLTDGVIYNFYTDIEKPNIMDETPFITIDLNNLRNNQIDELKRFHKTQFNAENILNIATKLKYERALGVLVAENFTNPSPNLVKLFAQQVYDGRLTDKIITQFTELVQKAIISYIDGVFSDKMKMVLNTGITETKKTVVTDEVDENEKNSIITTTEELEAFYIIKSIIRNILPSERIFYRDQQQYFTVIIDDNNRKCVCRLYFNSDKTKFITIDDVKYKINCLDDIFLYTEQLIKKCEYFK
jgi:hypothetical protein